MKMIKKQFNINIFQSVLSGLKILSFIVLIHGCSSTKSFTDHFSFLTKDTFSTTYEKNASDTNKLFNWNHDSTSLYFLKDFNDTVVVYLNHRKVFKTYINNNNYPYLGATKGAEFSGVTFSISTKLRKPVIDVELKSKKRFIEFILDKNFPSCDIDHSNGNWTINYRYHSYEININVDIIKK